MKTFALIILGLLAGAPARALDAACTATPNLGMARCPADSEDWYESYTDQIDELDVLALTSRLSSHTVLGSLLIKSSAAVNGDVNVEGGSVTVHGASNRSVVNLGPHSDSSYARLAFGGATIGDDFRATVNYDPNAAAADNADPTWSFALGNNTGGMCINRNPGGGGECMIQGADTGAGAGAGVSVGIGKTNTNSAVRLDVNGATIVRGLFDVVGASGTVALDLGARNLNATFGVSAATGVISSELAVGSTIDQSTVFISSGGRPQIIAAGTSAQGASVEWRTGHGDTATRNWIGITDLVDFGDLAFRQGASKGANPQTSGTTIFRLSAAGNGVFTYGASAGTFTATGISASTGNFSSGVGIGTNTSPTQDILRLGTNGAATATLLRLVNHGGNAVGAGMILAKARGDSLNSPTTVLTGDAAGTISMTAFGTTPNNNIARITSSVTAATDAAMSGDLIFQAAQTGSLVEVLRVSGANRYVGIGGVAVPDATLTVNGNIDYPATANLGRYLYVSTDSTGNGFFTLQAGGISAAYGGGLTMYANAHATNPGDLVMGMSGNNSSSFRIMNQGTDGGSILFKMNRAGNAYFAAPLTSISSFTSTANMEARGSTPLLALRPTQWGTSNPAYLQAAVNTSASAAGDYMSVQAGTQKGITLVTNAGVASFVIQSTGSVILSSGTSPTAACDAGTASLSVGSGPNHGTLTSGAASVNCTVTFNAAWPKAPVCNFISDTALGSPRISSVSTTAVTFAATLLNGAIIYYQCMGAP